MKKIGIVNYSLGNVGSVASALSFYGQDIRLIDSATGLADVDAIVLAGVGNFKTAVDKLNALKLREAVHEQVVERKKPVLGVCLGMQLFADSSTEGGDIPGFGWIKGKVEQIEGQDLRLPHIGWNDIEPADSELFGGMRGRTFYFMHSYHFRPADPSVVIATTRYHDVELVSAVKKDNIVGVQFHPEKSQGDGLRFLRNFLESIN
ncbi:MAG: imidazole glycerol phosphate synthase subunit HisH [Candidatus Obscuribacterales bacterium]